MDYTNYIARCIELARLGEYYVAPNPMVGAVLVRNSDETIIGEGWHRQFGQAHAEVNCFADAERKIRSSITKTAHCLSVWSLAAITVKHRLAPN